MEGALLGLGLRGAGTIGIAAAAGRAHFERIENEDEQQDEQLPHEQPPAPYGGGREPRLT